MSIQLQVPRASNFQSVTTICRWCLMNKKFRPTKLVTVMASHSDTPLLKAYLRKSTLSLGRTLNPADSQGLVLGDGDEFLLVTASSTPAPASFFGLICPQKTVS